MEKEFVPQEQSLELKELNAYIECFGFYWFNGSSNIWVLETKEYEDEYSKTISAPTFSQAFRWFREKYKLFHSITEYNKDGSLIIEISKDRVEIFRKMTNFDFTEYKQAELECLKKLIEIVK